MTHEFFKDDADAIALHRGEAVRPRDRAGCESWMHQGLRRMRARRRAL